MTNKNLHILVLITFGLFLVFCIYHLGIFTFALFFKYWWATLLLGFVYYKLFLKRV